MVVGIFLMIPTLIKIKILAKLGNDPFKGI